MKVLEAQSAKFGGQIYTVVPCEFVDYEGNDLWKSEELRTVNLWCWDAFGKQGQPYDGTGCQRWYQQHGQFWFRDEADVTWFTLRWK